MERVLPLLGRRRRIAAARYRKLTGEEVEESYEDLQSYAQAIKGDKAFADRILREAGKAPILRNLSEARVASAVAAGLGLDLRDLETGGRQRNVSRARHIAAYLGRAVCGILVARMARYFGRDESTFVRGVLRLEESLANAPTLRRNIVRLEKALQSLNT